MNTARKLLVIAAALSLSACATSGTAVNNGPPGHSEYDDAYVAAVDDMARHSSVRVRVIWVNPPVVDPVEQVAGQ